MVRTVLYKPVAPLHYVTMHSLARLHSFSAWVDLGFGKKLKLRRKRELSTVYYIIVCARITHRSHEFDHILYYDQIMAHKEELMLSIASKLT